eukprot:CAMPEP_0171652788 /NCGR_PEP_ID=MMETSP0990-20121206/39169_1 /TAXON_ID=483369 /ORGANISM="non described non described, Strain CCMP2098" /LENGTH=88 /DNA_ID=CAMNT_0012232087 /DNA_START=374 /DNA_END=637 /DNA_ORIENTATION=+
MAPTCAQFNRQSPRGRIESKRADLAAAVLIAAVAAFPFRSVFTPAGVPAVVVAHRFDGHLQGRLRGIREERSWAHASDRGLVRKKKRG